MPDTLGAIVGACLLDERLIVVVLTIFAESHIWNLGSPWSWRRARG